MGRAVGIDLGTTNSCIATLEGGEPTVIVNAEGARTTPSVVAFSKSGEILVGEVAKRQAVTNVDRTISSVKRHMGTDWTVEIDGKKWTPQEISAQILMKLKRDAEAYLGEPVTDAVITCPAYFNDAQRQATKDAGKIAGLNVLRIINEPTAAALAYGLEKGKEDERILVFDLGGGTFDVSLLEIGKDDDGFSTIQVKATNGDNHLGGDDWDQKVIDWLVGEVKNKYGVDLSKDKIALQRLKEAAEQAKKELSSSTSTSINMQYLAMTPDGTPVHLDETLTRAHFEEMTSDLLGRCRTPFNGIVHVSAKDKGTGKEQSMTITGGSGLPKDEIDRMVKEAEAHEAEDKKRKEDAETRNQAEAFAYQTEKLVNDNKDKISDEIAKEVTDKVNALKEALKGEDIEKIKGAQSELMTSAQKIGEALYAQQGAAGAADAAGAAAGASGAASNGGDDDVVDAEVVDDDDKKDNK